LHITYVLLSPTFGMHQYTADLANRMAAAGHQVQLVTTTLVPRDRYSPQVQITAPVIIEGTGFSAQGLHAADLATILAAPALHATDLVHITGVHLWNVPLVWALRRRRLPVVHTLHDLDPHHGVRFAPLIRLWNREIVRSATHILVHGRRYRAQLIAGGLHPARVTAVPLLHGFWGFGRGDAPAEMAFDEQRCPADTARGPTALFFGRIEQYKGIDILLAAWRQACAAGMVARLVIAGPLAGDVVLPSRPAGVELRDRRIDDTEALALFSSADLLVLPYRDATQSALIAAAYSCRRPVLVTRTGALAEYVIEDQTGWVVPPGDVSALAVALQDALADSYRLERMGAAGRTWYDEQRPAEWRVLVAMYQAFT
jgi:glycosyltransferase involved in cell wall biosynthesis